MPKTDQEKAEKLYLAGGSSYASLAKKFGVSERTVKRWAETGNWQGKKQAEQIVSQALASEVSELLQRPVQTTGVSSTIRPEDIVELALTVSYTDLQDGEIRNKSKGEIVASIEKMLKLQHQMSLYKHELESKQIQLEQAKADLALKQRQLNPPTLKAWLDICLGDFKYTVPELLAALKKLYQEYQETK